MRTGKEILNKVRGIQEVQREESENALKRKREAYEASVLYQKKCLEGYTEFLFNSGRLEVEVIMSEQIHEEVYTWLKANDLKLEFVERGTYLLKVIAE